MYDWKKEISFWDGLLFRGDVSFMEGTYFSLGNTGGCFCLIPFF